MTIKLKPTLDRIAVKPDPAEMETKGGIILPKGKKNCYGIVLAIGPGGFNMDGSRREMSVKVGDRILYTGCHDLTATGDKEVVMIDDEDVLAVAKGK